MKTKLYVAGIGSCVLLMSVYFWPYELFSANATEQSKTELSVSAGLLNYEKAAIPGLEIKTPAKVAVVNKIAASQQKKEEERKRLEQARLDAEKSILDIASETVADVVSEFAGEEMEAETEAAIESEIKVHPYVASSRAVSKKRFEKPAVNMPRPAAYTGASTGLLAQQQNKSTRTVVNYPTTDFAYNTGNTNNAPGSDLSGTEDNQVNTGSLQGNDFSGGEGADDLAEAAAGMELKETKAVKTYSFRGKAEVRSDLYKFIPPYWDGFSEEIGNESTDLTNMLQKAAELAAMAKKEGFNSDYAFLADMSVKSNKNRFYIINLKTMKVEASSLVAQGRGREKLNLDKDYSNAPGSNCSSLGIYKVGKAYNGSFGHSYRLHGLESSNSNALKRLIVLHAMGTIPDVETNFPIWQSEGCPSLSPSMLEKVGNLIDNSGKPILMWMYDDTFIPVS